jgi:multidrug resistance efflux pump
MVTGSKSSKNGSDVCLYSRGRTLASLVTLERKLEEVVTQFIADHMQKLAEAERKADRLEQELIKAQSKNERAKLRAPIAGTVQQLAVTTVGQVVTSGQALLTIVPFDSPIEIEVMIQNKDIGFVETGQAAAVKIESFPFQAFLEQVIVIRGVERCTDAQPYLVIFHTDVTVQWSVICLSSRKKSRYV